MNFFLAIVGTIQVTRIGLYRASVKDESPKDIGQAVLKDETSSAEGVAKDVEGSANTLKAKAKDAAS